MNSTICTLFEGDYHFGVGALVNSLYKYGFRGTIWVGYRGSLPPWAKNLMENPEYKDCEIAEGCIVRFLPLTTTAHFTNYKPTFMLDILRKYDPGANQLFYFDPDIVIKCRWTFYEEWCSRGIALCQEIVNAYMPSNHPVRLAWKDMGEKEGFEIARELNQYFSGGFIGVRRDHASIIEVWKTLLDNVWKYDVDISKFSAAPDRSSTILSPDQDLLNLAAMITPDPLSTIGPEGMAFVPGGFTMAHAVGRPKPWRKKMLREAVRGKATTAADKEYLLNVREPIRLYTEQELVRRSFDARCGAALGRVMRRSQS